MKFRKCFTLNNGILLILLIWLRTNILENACWLFYSTTKVFYTIICFQKNAVLIYGRASYDRLYHMWFLYCRNSLNRIRCHNSVMTLARLFPSEIGAIVSSGFWLFNLYFILQFVLCHDSSLVSFTWEQLCRLLGLWHLIPLNNIQLLLEIIGRMIRYSIILANTMPCKWLTNGYQESSQQDILKLTK